MTMVISSLQDMGKIVALAACFVAVVVSYVHADDCSRARQEYERGTGLKGLEERRDVFQRSVELCPTYAEAHVNLADAYENMALHRPPEDPQYNSLINLAIEHYEKAIEHNPNLFQPYVGLGEIYMMRGQIEMAKQALESALSLNPQHYRTRKNLRWVEAELARQNDGFKTSKAILESVQASDGVAGPVPMGPEPYIHGRNRQRFINIIFDEWSDRLNRKETIEQLNEIGEALASEELANFTFIVEGHTDPRGGYERNVRLSWDRANAVKKYLVEKFKIDPSRINTQGLWYSRPRFPNDSSENMLKNRRVELLFIDNQEKR